jgi:transposase
MAAQSPEIGATREASAPARRRRHWSLAQKIAIVQETFAPGMTVALVARQHAIAPNQLFTWRRLYRGRALSARPPASGFEEDVVPISELHALQRQVRELERLLGKTTLENEVLREALARAEQPVRSRRPRPAADEGR